MVHVDMLNLYDAWVIIGALIVTSPFIALGLLVAYQLGRRFPRHRLIAGLAGGVSAVCVVWTTIFALVALSLAREAGRDPEWSVRLAGLLTALSGPVFIFAAVTGWLAANSKGASPPVSKPSGQQ